MRLPCRKDRSTNGTRTAGSAAPMDKDGDPVIDSTRPGRRRHEPGAFHRQCAVLESHRRQEHLACKPSAARPPPACGGVEWSTSLPASTSLPFQHASPPRKSVTKPPASLDQQHARRDVPRLQRAFPEAVVTPCRDPGEVERGRTEAADARDFGRDRAENAAPLREIAVAQERDAGRDQRIGQIAARRHAQAAVLHPGARPFSAQKLSSVSG